MNPAFEDVAPGEVGELVLRGETLMKGYWNNPEATRQAMRDGWLLTGDLATVDEHGLITLVDRKKDMIITGGMNGVLRPKWKTPSSLTPAWRTAPRRDWCASPGLRRDRDG